MWCMRWLMGLLALVMVLGPTLGQMHRAVHAGGMSKSVAHARYDNSYDASYAVVQAAAAIQSSSALDCGQSSAEVSASCGQGSWVHALFAGHGPSECPLLDQASHGLAGPPAVLEFAGVAPETAQPQTFTATAHHIFIAASFDARAPPLHSTWA